MRYFSGPDPAAQRRTAIVNTEIGTPAAFQASFNAHPFTLNTSLYEPLQDIVESAMA